MGHKGSKLQRKSAAELDRALEDGAQIEIKELAQGHIQRSIGTLVEAQRRRPTKSMKDAGEEVAPWTVRVRAAKDLLEMAGGRPETREPEDKTGGLTIIINQLTSEDQLERVVSGAQVARDVARAVDAEVVTEPPVPDDPDFVPPF